MNQKINGKVVKFVNNGSGIQEANYKHYRIQCWREWVGENGIGLTPTANVSIKVADMGKKEKAKIFAGVQKCKVATWHVSDYWVSTDRSERKISDVKQWAVQAVEELDGFVSESTEQAKKIEKELANGFDKNQLLHLIHQVSNALQTFEGGFQSDTGTVLKPMSAKKFKGLVDKASMVVDRSDEEKTIAARKESAKEALSYLSAAVKHANMLMQ